MTIELAQARCFQGRRPALYQPGATARVIMLQETKGCKPDLCRFEYPSFRADGEPTRDQVREMMRTMLAERFGLQVHEFTIEGH